MISNKIDTGLIWFWRMTELSPLVVRMKQRYSWFCSRYGESSSRPTVEPCGRPSSCRPGPGSPLRQSIIIIISIATLLPFQAYYPSPRKRRYALWSSICLTAQVTIRHEDIKACSSGKNAGPLIPIVLAALLRGIHACSSDSL